MISSLDIGGSQALVMNLYRKLDRTRIQFDFITDHPGGEQLKKEIEELGGRIYELPAFKGYNVREVRRAWDSFFEEHPGYRILHSHTRSYASIYLPAAKKHGSRTIVHSHSTSNGKGFKAAVKKVLQFPLRYQADYMFACSREAGKWLFGRKALSKPNFFILKNAIDTDLYRPDINIRKEYREKLGISSDTVVYIHIGRFCQPKNHMFLLDIFNEIHKKDSKTRLILVGDGELREKIGKRVGTLDLNSDVMLLGSRTDVPGLLQAADRFLFPSLWEGLPVTVVEAQAAGLPCLISDNITDEVCVTPLVRKLPLSAGADVWAKEAMSCKSERADTAGEIEKAGFSADTTAEWLSGFYEDIAK